MRITPVCSTLIFGFGVGVTKSALIVEESFVIVVVLLNEADNLLVLTFGLIQRCVKRVVIREDATLRSNNFCVAAAENESSFSELG